MDKNSSEVQQLKLQRCQKIIHAILVLGIDLSNHKSLKIDRSKLWGNQHETEPATCAKDSIIS